MGKKGAQKMSGGGGGEHQVKCKRKRRILKKKKRKKKNTVLAEKKVISPVPRVVGTGGTLHLRLHTKCSRCGGCGIGKCLRRLRSPARCRRRRCRGCLGPCTIREPCEMPYDSDASYPRSDIGVCMNCRDARECARKLLADFQ